MKPAQQVLTIKVLKTIYRKPDNGWSLLDTDQGQAVGVVPFDFNEGDLLKCSGWWQNSKRDGKRQFSFTTATLEIPEDSRALLHYAVELTKGLGFAAEERIWAAFGDTWREHELLEGVTGISRTALSNWKDTLNRLKEQVAKTQAIAFLLSKGCTLNMAAAAWTAWEENTISTVSGNCYMLADLPRYGFKTVDDGIRQAFDIGDGDPRRLDAAVLYVVNDKAQSDGTAVQVDKIMDELCKIVPDAADGLSASIERLVEKEKLVLLDLDAVALRDDHENEVAIWERFSA